MKYYMAPMEGLTGYIYRNAYQKYFHDIDRYFTPFITNKKLDFKVKKDIDPEHNQGMEVVPQILTNQPDDFISIVNQLKQYGYDEVNLNLGCPSGTVVAKNRGAGFLSVPDELDSVLDK
uniref:tRNA-dihydrouridine synthase n=1 Tax=Roseburia inulinivorans TaxID=360807 RepID=UPI004038C7A0